MSDASGTTAAAGASTAPQKRGGFSSRKVFIFAAIGSAVGLGNIWRFPYVAYENGGGAFLIPYLVALFCAGIPFLYLDYAMGHRHGGSSPLTWARMRRWTESLGWWHVMICVVIAAYYAAIIAWAAKYTIFSVDKAWGDDAEGFFFGDFLHADTSGLSFDFVPGILVPMVLIWIVVIAIMAAGVEKGIGLTSVIGIPVLVIAFGALVVQALFLDGASVGLEAFFTPNWEALTHAGVWAAAFGQIFFSLSVGFGIMITYSSYMDRDTDMTGSGTVVGLANSSFELLAGIGVFAALGFMAQANGVTVDEVASGGIGLAFIVFPTIISQAPGGAVIGVLFFGSLVLAGVTSLVSILEVIISAVRDKMELGRVAATMVVTVPIAVVSVLFFATASGVAVLDIADYFINQFGILFAALVAVVVLAWVLRKLPLLQRHLDARGSVKLRGWWPLLVGTVVPVALGYIFVESLKDTLDETYGGYETWMVGIFGWGVAGGAIVLAVLLALMPWRKGTSLEVPADRDLEPTPSPAQEGAQR
ncbi:sodium-dependent transporter [Nocardioides yefusunii]|uniref:Transporter n=1 Tax=Nocardioides yefusunii TaxID=2500546 RepID=A0ABW1R0C2_9ACTN|nr:sodium-dependent transporter [Nocardioides yefusunii]